MFEMKKVYCGLDFFKIVCAVLIVFMHTYCRDLKYGQDFVSIISNIGVPYFFIVSGFFYAKGLMRPKPVGGVKYASKYFGRAARMYVAWSVLTVPIAFLIIERAHGDYSLGLKVAYFIRLFFFTGSIGIYWYVLALVYNSIIIYVAFKKNKEYLLYVLAFAFWVVGMVYNSPYNNGNPLFQAIHVVFGSERNFLTVGLFYMCIGFFFAKNEAKINFKLGWLVMLFCLSVALRGFEYEYLRLNAFQSVEAVLLFLIGVNTKFGCLNEHSVHIRKLSTAIYLEHFPYILLFDFYLRRGTMLDFSTALLFCVILYFVILRLLPERIVKVLYGG